MSFDRLMDIKSGKSAASADDSSPVDEDPGGEPSPLEPSNSDAKTDAIAEPNEERSAPAAPRAQQSEPELTPIVLPGPPQAPKPSTAPFWEPSKPRQAGAEANKAQESADQTGESEPLPATAPLPISPTTKEPIEELFASDPLPEAETGEYEKIAVVGSEKTHARYMPWVIVGAGAVLAIVASLVVVFAVRGGETPAPTAEPTTQSPAEPTTSEPTEEPTTEPTETEPAADEPPKVDVGDTGNFKIGPWSMQGEISSKFGWPSFTIANDNLTFEGGTLLPQFPDSCAEMRTGFGITKKADGTFEVYRPAKTCAEAPDFYDEVWGLTAAIIPTLKAG